MLDLSRIVPDRYRPGDGRTIVVHRTVPMASRMLRVSRLAPSPAAPKSRTSQRSPSATMVLCATVVVSSIVASGSGVGHMAEFWDKTKFLRSPQRWWSLRPDQSRRSSSTTVKMGRKFQQRILIGVRQYKTMTAAYRLQPRDSHRGCQAPGRMRVGPPWGLKPPPPKPPLFSASLFPIDRLGTS